MNQKVQITKSSNFYKDYRETKPALLLGLILLTCGFYILHWIYVKNKEFEEIDHNAPNSVRGAIILMIMPFFWFFIIMIFKKLLITQIIIIKNIELIGWSLIIFLILKYLFDFCISFGKITKTSGLGWYIFYLIPIISIIFCFFKFYWLSPLIIFLFMVIPLMQSELNSNIKKFHIKKENNSFYN